MAAAAPPVGPGSVELTEKQPDAAVAPGSAKPATPAGGSEQRKSMPAMAPDAKAPVPALPAAVSAQLLATDRVVDVIRHGQSEYNAAKESCATWLTCRCWCCCDPGIRDPLLSPEGRHQVRALHRYLRVTQTAVTVQLVVVSPLRRAVATALGAWGVRAEEAAHNSAHDDGLDAATAGFAKAPAMAVPPFVVHPALREVMDTWGDVGSSSADLLAAFPHAPHTARASLAELPDGWWYFEPRKGRESVTAEPKPVLRDRMAELRAFLLSRPERHIALVGHSGFFKTFTSASSKLANCEHARFVLAADGTLTPVPLPAPKVAMAAAAAASAAPEQPLALR